MSDFAYGNDAEYWHDQYQKLFDACSTIIDMVKCAEPQQEQKQPMIKKTCILCGWYSGKGMCAKAGHRACPDWEPFD